MKGRTVGAVQVCDGNCVPICKHRSDCSDACTQCCLIGCIHLPKLETLQSFCHTRQMKDHTDPEQRVFPRDCGQCYRELGLF